MTTNRQEMTTCPHCGNEQLYLLGDGRYKCSACRKRFSPGRRRSRLTAATMETIIAGFADGAPALTIATETGLNPKTVQNYYRRIRELLAEERVNHLANCYSSAEVATRLFSESATGQNWKNVIFIGCLVARDSEIELLFSRETDDKDFAGLDPATISGWLVAADREALDHLQLDRIYCLAGNCSKETARTFWLNAKHRLSAYCGGFRENFHLYLREMEFRENIGSSEAARERIGALLKQD